MGVSSLFSVRFFFWSLLNIYFASSSPNGTVILVSFDGFRWDYIDMHRTNTDHFDSIIQTGVKAQYVRNYFPTVTFPNHYSIVTGLFPESHGLISNEMYDPDWNDTFTMRTNDSRWWNSGEPVWVTNEKQGRKSGLCFWPGYDVEIKGFNASYGTAGLGYGKPFADTSHLMSWKDRVDLVLRWLKKEDPPSFVALYFDSPDEAGHCCGPDSKSVTEEISRTNNITGYLLEKLRDAELLDKVNLIITADHGTAAFNASTVLDFDGFKAPNISYDVWSYLGSVILLNSTNNTATYDRLKKAEKQTKRFKVYRKEDVPDDLHFKHNNRVPEIVVIMEEGWIASISQFNATHAIPKGATKGAHGWLPSVPSMRPLFIAQGPAFKQGYKSGPIDMVDIYPLICQILGIEPAPHNGSLSRISHLLGKQPEGSSSPKLHVGEIVALVVGSTIAITICIYGFLMVLQDRRRGWRHHQPRACEYRVPLMHGDEDDDVVL